MGVQKNQSTEKKKESKFPKKNNGVLLTFSPTKIVLEPKERKIVGEVMEFSPGDKFQKNQSIKQKELKTPKKTNGVLLTFSPTRIEVEPKERKIVGEVMEFSPGDKFQKNQSI